MGYMFTRFRQLFVRVSQNSKGLFSPIQHFPSFLIDYHIVLKLLLHLLVSLLGLHDLHQDFINFIVQHFIVR